MVNNNLSEKKSKQLLEDVVLIRIVLIVLLVLYHSFAIYNGAWDMPEGIGCVKAYWWIASISYSFLLETFVFVSGYVFGYQVRTKYQGAVLFKTCVTNKARRLLIPSVIFSILYMICFYENTNMTIYRGGYEIINAVGHMWFLPMLFWCFVGIFVVEKLRIPQKVIVITAIFASLFSIMQLPLRLSSAAYYFLFFYLGYILQKNSISLQRLCSRNSMTAFLFLWVAVFVISKLLFDIPMIEELKNTSVFYKVLISVSARFSKIVYSLSGLLFLLSLTNYLVRIKGIDISNTAIKFSGYCFGVYICQQFILKVIMYNDTMISLFGSYLLPWIAFIITFILSVVITRVLLNTKIGRFLIG